MTRRDRHLVSILVSVLMLNAVTTIVAVVCCFSFRSRFRALDSELRASVGSSERASVEAAAAVLAVADRVGSGSGVDVEDPRPQVIGYGQTRTSRARYVYRDLRDPDGTVRREFVYRFPLSHP